MKKGSNKQVANEQARQENKEKGLLIDLQKKKEQIEKEQKLEQERLKADGVLKAQEQTALRDRNRNVVEAHVELMENEIKLLLDKDTYTTKTATDEMTNLKKRLEKAAKQTGGKYIYNIAQKNNIHKIFFISNNLHQLQHMLRLLPQ